MINYDKFLFASAPRTGTTYFMKAAVLAGYKEGFKAHVHVPFPDDAIPKKATDNIVLRVSMVRHPVDWFVSYYCSINPGSTGIEAVDELLTLPPAEDFDEWAYNYAERMPGHLKEIYDTYQANTCLRIEDSPWNVIELFDSYRPLTKDQTGSIQRLGKQNITKHLPEISRRAVHLITDAEKEVMERYDY